MCKVLGLSTLLLAIAVFDGGGGLSAWAEEASDDKSQAAALLETAESQAARGKYDAAVSAYRKLAKEFPETEAGRTGAQRSAETAYLGWSPILSHGPSENRIDIVVMGDGYRLKDQKKFDGVAAAVPNMFKRHHLFGEYLKYHNFLRANLRSKDCHVDAHGREFDTALNGQAREGPGGQVHVDAERARAFAAHVPGAEGLCLVFVQRGKLGHGGGGVATMGGRADALIFHEWGHAFGALGDEYSIGSAATGLRDAPNVSNTEDEGSVPWRHWINARVPGVGVYEGALGQARGAWKSTNRCAMDKGTDFCVVCREALLLRIYQIVDPIDGCTPEPHDRASGESLEATLPPTFGLRVMEPAKHALSATWWVLAEDAVPEDPEPLAQTFASGDRRNRGPLNPIAQKPVLVSKKPRKGRHEFTFDAGSLAPGRYRVVCRVEDPARCRGDRWPWVLKDDHGLLVSERAWWVEVN